MTTRTWWLWVGLVFALGACRKEPLGDPWCACSAPFGSGSVKLLVYPQPIEGAAPFIAQVVKVYVERAPEPTLELDTEIENDSAILRPEDVRLVLVAPNRYQLRLDGWEQEPVCHRVLASGKLQPEACAEGTDVACHYRPLRPDH